MRLPVATLSQPTIWCGCFRILLSLIDMIHVFIHMHVGVVVLWTVSHIPAKVPQLSRSDDHDKKAFDKKALRFCGLEKVVRDGILRHRHIRYCLRHISRHPADLILINCTAGFHRASVVAGWLYAWLKVLSWKPDPMTYPCNHIWIEPTFTSMSSLRHIVWSACLAF